MGVRALVLATSVALLLVSARSARASRLPAPDIQKLSRGATVSRRQALRVGPRRYVGGVAYSIIDADPDAVTSMLDDVGTWRRLLPDTREVERVGMAGADTLVRVTHGSALVSVAYTLRIRREGHGVRFWMDPSRSHEIEDAWGFFRTEPMPDGRTLMSYGILIDMGDGLLRDLFEGRVLELALQVPDRVRRLALRQLARGRRASR